MIGGPTIQRIGQHVNLPWERRSQHFSICENMISAFVPEHGIDKYCDISFDLKIVEHTIVCIFCILTLLICLPQVHCELAASNIVHIQHSSLSL